MLPSKRPYANRRRYAQMVAEDREPRLASYEVYRFGGSSSSRPGDGTAARRVLRPSRQQARHLNRTVFRRRAPPAPVRWPIQGTRVTRPYLARLDVWLTICCWPKLTAPEPGQSWSSHVMAEAVTRRSLHPVKDSFIR
jgi:hypothetical protein